MTRDFLVGMLFLVSIFILIWITVVVEGVSFGRQEYHLEVQFNSVSGLVNGDQVRMRGHAVGEVEELKIKESEAGKEDSVTVTLLLYREIEPRAGYSFKVLPASTLGGTFVDYNPGDPGGTPIPETVELRGSGHVNFFTEAGELISENRESFHSIVENIRVITSDIRRGKGLLGTLSQDDQFARDAHEAFRYLNSITMKIDQGEGILGAILNDQDLTNAMREVIYSGQEVARKIATGVGPVGILINDETVAVRIQSIIERLDEITADINDGKGLLGRLINDTELADKVEMAVDDLQKIFAQIRRGEGTLGQLIVDSKTIDELNRLLILGRESIEDFREQAPINSFFNILGAAF
ncbi:MAG: MlaD family protein [Planctomycetota bacterium]